MPALTNESSTTSTSHATKAELSAVSDDLASLREDIALLTKHLAKDAKNAASEQLDRLNDAAHNAAGAVKHSVEDAHEGLNARIRAKPISSVLIAAAAGAVIAKVAFR